MDVVWGIILAIIIPLLIGSLFLVVIGGPIYLLMKGFEYFMFFVVNPIIAKIRDIPFIGKLLCFIITTCIGLPLIGVLIVCLCIPMIGILGHAISGGTL